MRFRRVTAPAARRPGRMTGGFAMPDWPARAAVPPLEMRRQVFCAVFPGCKVRPPVAAEAGEDRRRRPPERQPNRAKIGLVHHDKRQSLVACGDRSPRQNLQRRVRWPPRGPTDPDIGGDQFLADFVGAVEQAATAGWMDSHPVGRWGAGGRPRPGRRKRCRFSCRGENRDRRRQFNQYWQPWAATPWAAMTLERGAGDGDVRCWAARGWES